MQRFPNNPEISRLKFFKEERETYALFDWYVKRSTRFFRYRGVCCAGVCGLLPVTDEEISSDFQSYGVQFERATIRRWRKTLIERGRIACIWNASGWITVVVGIGEQAVREEDLPALCRPYVDEAIAEGARSAEDILLVAISCVIETMPGVEWIPASDLTKAVSSSPRWPFVRTSNRSAIGQLIARLLHGFGIHKTNVMIGTRMVKSYPAEELRQACRTAGIINH